MKKYLYILLSIACAAGIVACEKSDDGAAALNNKDAASLTISVDVPTFSATTRTAITAIATDPENSGNSWTNWDKFVDGALLYRVTIFVIDSSNKLAAWRNIYSGGDIQATTDTYGGNGFWEDGAVKKDATTGVAVKATFDSANPLHGEQLQAGNYKVIAVANYAPIDTNSAVYDGTNTYLGLGSAAEDGTSVANGDGGDFTTLVNKIISEGVGFDFTGTDGQALFNYTLNSGDDRVCKLMPQPLVMVRDVTLTNGQTTTLNGQLSRTFARVRLTTKNTDASNMVGISNLAFNGAYASKQAYLFNDKSAGAAKLSEDHKDFALYDTTANTLNVSSEDAIIPFSSTMRRLSPNASYNIFDCYILEGQIEADYAFSFTASYWTSASTGGATQNYMITNWVASGNSYGLLEFMVFVRNNTSDSNYLMEAVPTTTTDADNNTIITGGTMQVSTSAVSNATDEATTALDPKYVWEIQTDNYSTSSQVGVAYGNFYSIGYGLYLQAYDGDTSKTPKLAYSKSPTDLIFRINFSGQDEQGTILCVYNNTYWYINQSGVWTNSNVLSSSNVSSVDGYRLLTFETITGAKGSQTDKTITRPIVMSSSGSTGTNAIARNDFFWGTIPIKVESTTE